MKTMYILKRVVFCEIHEMSVNIYVSSQKKALYNEAKKYDEVVLIYEESNRDYEYLKKNKISHFFIENIDCI